MKPISRNALQFLKEKSNADVLAILCIIEHPELSEPLRISTDNKSRFSVQPSTYGTWSKFGSTDGKANKFYFIGMEVLLPDAEEDGDPTASLLLNVIDSAITDTIVATSTKATCRMAVVLASTPDVVEFETTGLELSSVSGNWAQLQIKFTVEDLSAEPMPWVRFSRQHFPGLHK